MSHPISKKSKNLRRVLTKEKWEILFSSVMNAVDGAPGGHLQRKTFYLPLRVNVVWKGCEGGKKFWTEGIGQQMKPFNRFSLILFQS